ncbi:hypothetical protein F5Y19DRAFT_442683, partial [Xylariaceae sp. FL1651]
MAPPRLKATKKTRDSTKLIDMEDYLDLGDSHEEAMRKHRVGDPVKALRFADRALDVYTQGLAKFPQSFDLAYNKARLELEKANDPIFSQALEVPVVSVLRQALSSHQYARDLDPLHADTLFNMAQVLTTMAEIIAEDDESDDTEALQNIEQALDIQSRCFEIQQATFVRSHLELEQAMRETAQNQPPIEDEQSSTISATGAQNTGREEQWVSIEEPVTAFTLLETVIAQIEALSALCSILSSSIVSSPGQDPASAASLSWINRYSTKLLAETLPALIHDNHDTLEPRLSEVMLSKAVFTSNYLELSFRLSMIDVEKYKQELDIAFAQPEINATSEDVLLASAHALLTFNSALADLASANKTETSAVAHAGLRWKILLEAQSRLTSVANIPNVDKHTIATTHLLRGDISLLLQVLAYPPAAYPQARTTTPQLLNHAGVYYRNAGKLFASVERSADEEKASCDLKGAVVTVLQQVTTAQMTVGSSASQDGVSTVIGMLPCLDQIKHALEPVVRMKGEQWTRDQIEDMANDGLIIPEIFSAIMH